MGSYSDQLEKQVRDLEEKLSTLKHENSEQEKNLTRAAEIGKKLLVENAAMEERMQGQAKEHRKDIELLEQEKFSLQRNLEHKVRMESDYVEEIEGLTHSLSQMKDQLSIKAEAEYQQEVSKLKKQVSEQQADIDRLNLSEKQLKERNLELENEVDDVRQQLQHKISSMNETSSEEIAELHYNISKLEGDKLSLVRELGDNKDQVQQLMLAVSSAREQLAFKDTEIEERACQTTSYYNALEKSREENQELRVQVDMLRMESQDQKAKGNSLFSEVEDRRVVVEKQLITMKVEYESLRKQYEVSQQSHCRLRMQLAGLLQSSSSRADQEHLHRLQQQLSQKNDEVNMLMIKLHKYEKQATSSEEDSHKILPADKMDHNYVAYIQTVNDHRQKELDKLKHEIRTKSLRLLAESDKLMQCERKLYAKERELEMYKGKNMKQQVEIDELKLKYEPEKLKMNMKVMKTVREKIPLSKSDQEAKNTKAKDSKSSDDKIVGKTDSRIQSSKVEAIKPVKNFVKLNSAKVESKVPPKSGLKTKLDDNNKSGNQADQPKAKVPLISKVMSNLTEKSDDTGLMDKNFKSMKKRKVTISDENVIVEPDSPVYTEENSNESADVSIEKESRVRGRVRCRKTMEVPPATTKLSDNPNECKNQ